MSLLCPPFRYATVNVFLANPPSSWCPDLAITSARSRRKTSRSSPKSMASSTKIFDPQSVTPRLPISHSRTRFSRPFSQFHSDVPFEPHSNYAVLTKACALQGLRSVFAYSPCHPLTMSIFPLSSVLHLHSTLPALHPTFDV